MVKKIKLKKVILSLFLIMLTITSIIIRSPKVDGENYKNADATYHILLTMKAYDETPSYVHRFLPIVSLGNEQDKNISWGATIPDNKGNYYYTSFSPAGYLAPYLFIKAFGLSINELSLYIFNTLICLICCILSIILFKKIFKEKLSIFEIGIFTSFIYLFQLEVLHSQGIVYWHQSLFQMLLLLQLILFLSKESKILKFGFFVLCLINPYVEWTGYISNIGFVIGMLLNGSVIFKEKKIKISRNTFKSIVLVIIMTCLSFCVFSLHYLAVVSKEQYLNALKGRFFARTLVKAKFTDMVIGYWYSYKFLLVILLILFCIILSVNTRRKEFIDYLKEKRTICFLIIFPLLENIIMMQHATQYSFDRLKGIFPLLLFFFIFYAILKNNFKCKFKGIILISVIVTALFNLFEYANYNTSYRWKVDYLNKNKMLAEYLNSQVSHSNSILAQQISVRGYDNLLFDRGIYEGTDDEKCINLALKNNERFATQLLVKSEPSNIDEYIGCRIYNLKENDLKIVEFEDDKLEERIVKSIVVSGKTDNNWTNGVSNENNMLLLANNSYNRENIKDAIALKSNNIINYIANIKITDSWIQVQVNDKDKIKNFDSHNVIEIIK